MMWNSWYLPVMVSGMLSVTRSVPQPPLSTFKGVIIANLLELGSFQMQLILVIYGSGYILWILGNFVWASDCIEGIILNFIHEC